jgi:hypothetical protein
MRNKENEVRTMRKFLRVFRALPQAFKLNSAGWMRVKGKPCHCPVTAVCESITGVKYDAVDVYLAADTMRFPQMLANRVVEAADLERLERSNDINRRHYVLRRRLLKAKGLL